MLSFFFFFQKKVFWKSIFSIYYGGVLFVMAQQNGISCIIGFVLAIPFVGVSFAKDTFLMSSNEKLE